MTRINTTSATEGYQVRRKRMLRIALMVITSLLLCCGIPGYWLFHQSLHGHPERIYPHYSQELDVYGQRLETGDVQFVEGRGYAVPQFLIDKGVKWVYKSGSCYGIVFTSMLDNPTPMLWFSPGGFDPIPREVAKIFNEPQAEWRQLSPTWGMCYKPWWLNAEPG